MVLKRNLCLAFVAIIILFAVLPSVMNHYELAGNYQIDVRRESARPLKLIVCLFFFQSQLKLTRSSIEPNSFGSSVAFHRLPSNALLAYELSLARSGLINWFETNDVVRFLIGEDPKGWYKLRNSLSPFCDRIFGLSGHETPTERFSHLAPGFEIQTLNVEKRQVPRFKNCNKYLFTSLPVQ